MSKRPRRSARSEASFMSAQSDQSREYPPNLSHEPRPTKMRRTEILRKRKSQPGSSAASFMSAQSDQSREYPPNLSHEPRPTKMRRTEILRKRKSQPGSSAASLMSAKSDQSREYPPNLGTEPRTSKMSDQSKSSEQPNPDSLKGFELKAVALLRQALRSHKKVLSAEHEGLFEENEEEDTLDHPAVEFDPETSEAALKIALHTLRTMNQREHAATLEKSHYGVLVMYQKKLKSILREKTQSLVEGMAAQWPVPLKTIYTKLYLMEGDSGQINTEHEVRQIEAAFNRWKSSDILIRTAEIFKPSPGQQDKPIRTVLTKGIAGIGKSVLAQKFVLDWSEEKANQDIDFVFLLPFRELNLLKNERRSLMELLWDFSPGLKESEIQDLKTSKVLFILDGLDECRFPLDFKGSERCWDASQSASVDVLLTNLIAGKLLPSACVWLTTRPAAASAVPAKYVDRVTEIRGFNNIQKEQYFHKKIDDEILARRVIANIKSTRSLYIMCHVPVFCWISSLVLGDICATTRAGKMPRTLTQMYIHFLVHQINRMRAKFSDEQQQPSQNNGEMILSLGKLAFQELMKGNLIFYEDDLTESGIDVKVASVYSGLCTQVFREELWMQQKVFCFVHLSVQEFLAALYVHVRYKVDGENLMIETPDQTSETKLLSRLHKDAVDEALQSENGHLDLFLRFLLGLSLQSSQVLLRGLNIQVEPCSSQSHEETIKYITEKISQTLPPERYINLFHCLNELNDQSMVEKIQRHLDSDRALVMDGRSAAHWAALVFVLLTSPERPEEIQLSKYSRTEEGLLQLLPAIKASKSAMLNGCNLTAGCCPALSSTLSSGSNELNSLDLSDNRLLDSGMEQLCTGLQSPNCRLQILRLNRCGLTHRCCAELASVLCSPSSRLKELDLSDNDLEDSGVEQLCNGLGRVICKLETLRLSFCNVTAKGCEYLALAVKSNPSHLKELDLSYNHLGDSGVKLISDALDEGQCEFTKFRAEHNAEHRFKPGLRQYACELTLDPNSAHKLVALSEDLHGVRQVGEEQPYPDHKDRFDYWPQVLLQQGLQGRCYWEVEWGGKWAGIGVTYQDIGRKGQSNDCLMGYNDFSWSLHCSSAGYRAHHNFDTIVCPVPLSGSRGLAVYLDWEAGVLSFYRVSLEGSLTHLHTYNTRFTKPLYPVFRVWGQDSSVRLRQVKHKE